MCLVLLMFVAVLLMVGGNSGCMLADSGSWATFRIWFLGELFLFLMGGSSNGMPIAHSI